jgi:hypothetical protein
VLWATGEKGTERIFQLWLATMKVFELFVTTRTDFTAFAYQSHCRNMLHNTALFSGSYAVLFSTPNAYSYHRVSRYGITCAGKDYVTFRVRACNDAHLALMTYDRDNGPLYEIVIGGWGNGKCCMRKGKQGHCYREYHGRVLSCSSYNYFWVGWGGSRIRLGRGTTYGSSTLLDFPDSSYRVNYLAVSTGWGATGSWEFSNPPG